MSTFNFGDLASELSSAADAGVSFSGKGLKLDNACAAEPVVAAINACKFLEFLDLEGNTLGVEAAEAIAKALEKRKEFKKALWKDMFTGRMKTEIPKALHHLGTSMINANVRLTVLDLSDNAFGPNGMEGLVVLLGSPCYALEELRLNNNGLGIGGGRMLAKALLDCHANSKAAGKPLSLKVFVAGRNRLENDGSKALAEVFKIMGTLEEIAMPQNGIYAPGITALSEAFAVNKSLRVLNLNDNTIGDAGAKAIAKALPHIQQLEEINFGDCLLKTAGALTLAGGLKEAHTKLETLVLGYNEINVQGGIALVEALHNKKNLKSVVLDGNQFGDAGKEKIIEAMRKIGQRDVLERLSDDEGEPEEESENDQSDEESDESEDEYPEAPVITPTSTPIAPTVKQTIELSTPKFQLPSLNTSARTNIFSPKTIPENRVVNVEQFLKNPSPENFLALGNDRENMIMKEAKSLSKDSFLENFLPVLMKVSGLCKSLHDPVRTSALALSKNLYKELFHWAQEQNNDTLVNNTLLVNLGLIKSEDKKFSPTWDLDACLVALESVLTEQFFPKSTKETLQVFLGRNPDMEGTGYKRVLEALSNL